MAYTPKEKPFEVSLSSLLEKVDPLHAAVMVLGGTAAAAGIVPPMTALLQALNGGTGKNVPVEWDGTPQGNYVSSTGGIDFFTIIFGSSPPDWAKGLQGTPSQSQPMTPADRQHVIRQVGLFCSGAIEACIMYEFVKNPTTFTQLIKLPGELLDSVGSIVPKL